MTRFSSGTKSERAPATAEICPSLMWNPPRCGVRQSGREPTLVEVDLPLQVELVIGVFAGGQGTELDPTIERLEVRVVPERPESDPGNVPRLGGTRGRGGELVPLEAEDGTDEQGIEAIADLTHDRRALEERGDERAAVPVREVDLRRRDARAERQVGD